MHRANRRLLTRAPRPLRTIPTWRDADTVADPDARPDDTAARLRSLEERIERAKGKPAQKHHSEEHHSQAQLAWRMVIELVAGLSIGFGIGYGLDRLFGTMPIFLVLFIFLGLAAGIRTMMRSATEVQRKQEAALAERRGDDRRG